MTEIKMIGRGLRGESAADIARRLGQIAGVFVSSTATDDEVMAALATAFGEIVAAGPYTLIDPVVAATTANITLSGAQTIDGVAVVAGNRVLVKNQSSGAANGIYVAASGSWSRAADFDSSGEVVTGSFVRATGGATQAGAWVLTTTGTITVGTTAQVWRQFSLDALAMLARSDGAALVSFLQSGTGAGTRTLQDKGREIISVEDFYSGASDDATAWTRAWAYLKTRGGGVMHATQETYNFTSQVTLNAEDLTGSIRVEGAGAVLTTTGAISALLVTGNTNLCGVSLADLVVDHIGNTTAKAGFEQAWTARVSWERCFVRASPAVPAGYGGWLLRQTDPDDSTYACFWTRFPGSGFRSEGGMAPAGVILDGAQNATDFHTMSIAGATDGIKMRTPTGCTLAANLKPTANSVRVQGAWFEGCYNAVRFVGESGGYGPYGLIIDSRIEDVDYVLSLEGATLNYQQPPLVVLGQTLQSVTSVLYNPNGLECHVLDYRSQSGGASRVATTQGWLFHGSDAAYDPLVVDATNTGHGLGIGLNGVNVASLRYAISGLTELSGNGATDTLGVGVRNLRGLSSTGTRARNLTGTASFSSATTAAVTLPVAETDASYGVFFDSPANAALWVTSKATGGFTINASTAITGTVRWLLVR